MGERDCVQGGIARQIATPLVDPDVSLALAAL